MRTDKTLVNDIIQGDRYAMRELYDRYSGYAMAVCRRYIPDMDDVKDVMQESFVKVFQSLSKFEYRGDDSLKSWISRIVSNEALDYMRRKGRMSFVDMIPDIPDEPEPDIDNISDEMLTDLIARLPDGYRMVLNLYVFDQLSHKDIARKLGMTPSTSASQFFHAKKMLAKMINDYKKQH